MGCCGFFKFGGKKGSPKPNQLPPAVVSSPADQGVVPPNTSSPTCQKPSQNSSSNSSSSAVRVPLAKGLSKPNPQPLEPPADPGSDLPSTSSTSLRTGRGFSQNLTPDSAVAGALSNSPPVVVPGALPAPSLVPLPQILKKPVAESPARTLWEQAVDRLSPEDQAIIGSNPDKSNELGILYSFIQSAEESKKQCEERRLKYKNSQGQEVPVREFMNRLLQKLNKFVPMADSFVQPPPFATSLACGGFKSLLQIAISDMENTRIAMESLNDLARVLGHCGIYERVYSDQDLEATKSLNTSLQKLYISILEYLCYLKRHLGHNTAVQAFKNIWSGLQSRWAEVLNLEAEVDKEATVAHQEVGNTKIREILALLGGMKDFQEPILRIERIVADIFKSIQDEERGVVLKWLSEIPFRDHHDFVQKSRHPETGSWLLKEQDFGGWKGSNSSSLLWLHGIPGSGKTHLASKIIDKEAEGSKGGCGKHALAYFYCNYKEEERKNVSMILRTLIKQLCLAAPEGHFPEPVLTLYRKRKNDGELSTSISIEQSKELLVELSAGFLSTTIAIDALDECDENTRSSLIDVLGYLASSPKQHLVKIFVTSRDNDDLKTHLMSFPNIYIHENYNSGDLEKFIESEVETCIKTRKLLHMHVEGRKQLIINKLKEKAHGMFIWVKYQITKICSEVTWDGIVKSLEEPSKDLKAMYSEILEKIATRHEGDRTKQLAENALKWILYATKPPTPRELIEALFVKAQLTLELAAASPPDCSYLPLEKVLDICENFVVHDQKLGVLRFAHFSVQEFLRVHYTQDERLSHTRAAEVCLTVLTYHNTMSVGSKPSDSLLRYSCFNWWTHVRLSGNGSCALKELCKQFLRPSPAYEVWLGMVKGQYYRLFYQSKMLAPVIVASYFQLSVIFDDLLSMEIEPNSGNWRGQTALHMAAENGDGTIVQFLLNRKEVDVDSKDNDGWTPLSWASRNGHKEVAQMLLDRNVDADSKDTYYGRTPLSWASQNGHKEVAQMLLDRNVDADNKDNNGRTPLSWASQYGHKEVAQMLLDQNVDAESKDNTGRTPLSWASEYGHKEVAQMLLDRNVDADSKDNEGRTPLSWASLNGRKEVAQMLLDRNVDADSKDTYYGRTPLAWASRNGHKEVAQMLLDRNVDADSKDTYYGRTPLSWASLNGHKEVAQMLLDRNVDADSKDNDGRTPLSWASENGHKEVAQMLLDRNVDADSKETLYGRTPLSWASRNGHKEVAQMLLDRNVDADSKDTYYGRTPLSWASENGHKEVALMLLDRNVDADSKDTYYGRTPLSWASGSGHKEVAQMLLDRNVDADSKDNDGRTPLSWASEYGHKEVAQMLLDRNVDADSKDTYYGRTPLSWASENGHKEFAQMLLDRDVDADSKDNNGWTPLSWASENGHKEVAQMLLDRNVDADSKDNNGRTPLSWASENGHKEVAQMLLDRNVDADSKDTYYGRTPLSWASENGHKEFAQMLLDRDVDADSKDNNGRTPLSWASENGYKEVAQMLLDRNVDADSKDNTGRTPLSWASEYGHKEVAQMLLDRNVDADSKETSYGRTPLSWASRNGHKEVAQMLLDRNADANSKDNDGRTPLSWASENGHEEVVQMLLVKADVGSNEDSSLTSPSTTPPKEDVQIPN